MCLPSKSSKSLKNLGVKNLEDNHLNECKRAKEHFGGEFCLSFHRLAELLLTPLLRRSLLSVAFLSMPAQPLRKPFGKFFIAEERKVCSRHRMIEARGQIYAFLTGYKKFLG